MFFNRLLFISLVIGMLFKGGGSLASTSSNPELAALLEGMDASSMVFGDRSIVVFSARASGYVRAKILVKDQTGHWSAADLGQIKAGVLAHPKVSFTPNGRAVALGLGTEVILATIDHLPSAVHTKHFVLPEGEIVSTLAISPDAKSIAAGSFERIYEVQDTREGKEAKGKAMVLLPGAPPLEPLPGEWQGRMSVLDTPKLAYGRELIAASSNSNLVRYGVSPSGDRVVSGVRRTYTDPNSRYLFGATASVGRGGRIMAVSKFEGRGGDGRGTSVEFYNPDFTPRGAPRLYRTYMGVLDSGFSPDGDHSYILARNNDGVNLSLVTFDAEGTQVMEREFKAPPVEYGSLRVDFSKPYAPRIWTNNISMEPGRVRRLSLQIFPESGDKTAFETYRDRPSTAVVDPLSGIRSGEGHILAPYFEGVKVSADLTATLEVEYALKKTGTHHELESGQDLVEAAQAKERAKQDALAREAEEAAGATSRASSRQRKPKREWSPSEDRPRQGSIVDDARGKGKALKRQEERRQKEALLKG